MLDFYSVRVCLSVPAYFKFRVQGEGIMSSIYRGLVAVFDPMSKSDALATFADCVPRPRQPNFYMYRVMSTHLSLSDTYTLTNAIRTVTWQFLDRQFLDRHSYPNPNPNPDPNPDPIPNPVQELTVQELTWYPTGNVLYSFLVKGIFEIKIAFI